MACWAPIAGWRGIRRLEPQGRGFLTSEPANREGTDPRDYRRNHPRFSDDADEKNLRVVAALEEVAERGGGG